MHVLVEPVNVPEAEEWVREAMLAAYGGEFSHPSEEAGGKQRQEKLMG